MSSQMLFLIDVYSDWCKKNKFPRVCASDLLEMPEYNGRLNLLQKTWLENFISTWDLVNQYT